MSLISKILSKVPALNYEQFKARQLEIVERMTEVAKKVEAIDKKSGEKLLSYLANISLNAVGIPVLIPPQFGYLAAGFPVGFILLSLKVVKLKPYIEELKSLQAQFDGNVELLKLYEQTSFSIPDNDTPKNPLTGEDEKETAAYKAEQQKAAELAAPKILDNIGLGELQRSTGITDNGIYFIALLLLIGIIYYLRNKKTQKRKK